MCRKGSSGVEIHWELYLDEEQCDSLRPIKIISEVCKKIAIWLTHPRSHYCHRKLWIPQIVYKERVLKILIEQQKKSNGQRFWTAFNKMELFYNQTALIFWRCFVLKLNNLKFVNLQLAQHFCRWKNKLNVILIHLNLWSYYCRVLKCYILLT